ncbi:MAG: iron ABC transporter permease [Acidobacteriota bacterium]
MTENPSSTAAASEASLRPRTGLTAAMFFLLLTGLVVVFLMELTLGSVRVPLMDVLGILFGETPERASWHQIIWEFRMPRALAAICGGAALGACGLLLQTLLRNPLAGPWVLGVLDGAAVGVAFIIFSTSAIGIASLGPFRVIGDTSLAVGAMIGSSLMLLLVGAIARRVSTITLLIAGIMMAAIAKSLLSLLIHFVDEAEVRVIVNWLDGSFDGVTWDQLTILVPVVVVGSLAALLLVKPLNALLLGERYAASLGLSVDRARFLCLGLTAVLTGAVTAFCGPISFLGLAVPHLCRGLFNTSDHRILMPAVLMLGGMLALVADLVIHMPWGRAVLHLNTVTSMIGAPVVLWLVLHRRHLRSLEI